MLRIATKGIRELIQLQQKVLEGAVNDRVLATAPHRQVKVSFC